jgi:dTDP-D-glucose 4,6-dehydratase
MKPRRDWDNSGRRFGSTAKSAREIEFSSKVNITDGLKETVDWFKDNFDLINNSINKHHNSLNKF